MGTSRRTQTMTIGVGLAIGLGVLSISRRCEAAARCRVEVEGVESEAWARARAELEASALPAAGDCELIALRLGPDDEARLTIRTRDGRHAERPLREPDDLLPTTAALLITTDIAAEPPPPPTPAQPVPVAPREHPVVVVDRVPSLPPVREILIFGLQGGLRYGTGDLPTPVMNGFASLDIRRWEVGITGGADFGFMETRAVTRAASSSVTAGVFLGRREPVGPIQLFAGGRTILAFVTGRSEAMTPRAHEIEEAQGRGEVRVGAYAGAAIPRRSPVRFRTELGADFAPADVGGTPTGSRPPLSPWWTASLQLGVEFSR